MLDVFSLVLLALAAGLAEPAAAFADEQFESAALIGGWVAFDCAALAGG